MKLVHHNNNLNKQLLLIARKWKILLLISALGGCLSYAIAYYYIVPKFALSITIEPTTVSFDKQKITAINSSNLASKIIDSVFDSKIKTSLNIPDIETLAWRVVERKNTEKIFISLLWPRAEEGKRIIETLLTAIEEDAQPIVTYITEKLDADIDASTLKISAIDDQQKAIKLQLNALKKELEAYRELRRLYASTITTLGNSDISQRSPAINDVLLTTLAQQELISSHTDLSLQILQQEEVFLENELTKIEYQNGRQMSLNEKNQPLPLRISGDILCSEKPVTINNLAVALSGGLVFFVFGVFAILLKPTSQQKVNISAAINPEKLD